MLVPTGDPKVSKADHGAWMTPTGFDNGNHWPRTAPCFFLCQGPTQTVETVGLTLLLCLDNVGQFLQVPPP